MARTVTSLAKVAERFGVTLYRVRAKWRDELGCPALERRPYDLEAIVAWLRENDPAYAPPKVDRSRAARRREAITGPPVSTISTRGMLAAARNAARSVWRALSGEPSAPAPAAAPSTSGPTMADIALEGMLAGKEGFEVLYKYRPINRYTLDSLALGYVYFSSPEQLNDPFDPFLPLVSGAGDSLVDAFATKKPRIFCVTRDPASPLMWAHYADAGAGLCIGYAALGGALCPFMEVTYLDRLAGSRNLLDVLYLTKSKMWQHEQELRAVWPGVEPIQKGLVHPVSVGLGPKCSHRDMLRVRRVLPSTVRWFYKEYPIIDRARFGFEAHLVDDLIERYGHLPSLEEYYRDIVVMRSLDDQPPIRRG